MAHASTHPMLSSSELRCLSCAVPTRLTLCSIVTVEIEDRNSGEWQLQIAHCPTVMVELHCNGHSVQQFSVRPLACCKFMCIILLHCQYLSPVCCINAGCKKKRTIKSSLFRKLTEINSNFEFRNEVSLE